MFCFSCSVELNFISLSLCNRQYIDNLHVLFFDLALLITIKLTMPLSQAFPCSCCNASVQEHQIITCSICKLKFSYQCADLTVSEIRTLKSKRGLSWTCKGCSSMGDDIAGLRAAIVALKNEISELKQQTLLVKDAPLDDGAYEEIIQEIRERENRKANVILYGVAESLSNSRNERNSEDFGEAKKVLGQLSVDCDFSCSRLGIFDASKPTPRPLRLKLTSMQYVGSILRNAKKLKDTQDFKKIGISSDRTPRQNRYFKQIRQELLNRKSAGETDIYIAHVNGIPKVMKSKRSLN